jgi:tyrosyl-tRNA synthetase
MDLAKQMEVIRRGTVELVSEEEIIAKLKKGVPLRVKAGFDPTAPDLHLGHTVVMQKLKQFQDLGHQVIFLIGDFTARIGDPSGRDSTRPTLTEEIIVENAKTYIEQASKILDMEKAEVRYNSEWLNELGVEGLIRLTSHHTVARILERDDFKTRYTSGTPIQIHEFIYPLLQGYDSVALKADVELGGTDQIFNLLVGRQEQKTCGLESQVVLTMPLLVGMDGVQKMSKSYGNYIGINEAPREIFGKVMSVSDELMWNYYELLSDLSLDEISKLKEELIEGVIHPKIVKENLAMEMVARFHSVEAAKEVRDEFERMFAKKGKPDDIPTTVIEVDGEKFSLVDAIVSTKLCSSKSEARRMIKQGGVRVDDERVSDIDTQLSTKKNVLIQVGKRRFAGIEWT